MLQQQDACAAFADLVIETERIVIRWPTEADRDLMMAHERDPRIMAEIRDPLPDAKLVERVEQTLEPWNAAEGKWGILVVEHRGANDVRTGIGVVALHVVSYVAQRLELGWRLHPDWHGQGLATEAMTALVDVIFDTLAPHKLVAFCTIENGPSWRLMERLGMTREGRLRHHSQLGGQWRDDYLYSILRPEWDAARTTHTTGG